MKASGAYLALLKTEEGCIPFKGRFLDSAWRAISTAQW